LISGDLARMLAPMKTATLLLIPLLGCASPARSDHAARRPPNVVLLMADDLGYGELGCYGQRRIRTPRIDALAREGLRFERFYAGAPVCAPSRCTLLTGLHNGHTPVRDNREIQPEGQWPLPAESATLAEILGGAGYATGCFGKWGLGAPGSQGAPEHQGFDVFLGYLCQRQAHDHYPRHLWRNAQRVPLDGTQYAHELIVDAALQFVRDHAREPFLLYVPFTIPHLALQVPQDALDEYVGLWDDPPYDGSKGYRPHPTPRAAYAAMITRMDRDVGRIVDLIEELGLGRDTLILFTSDNGPTYDRLGGSDSEFFDSAAGLRGLKGSVYEGGLRVPLVARWPGRIRAGAITRHVAANYDILPTLAELCGAAPAQGIDGLSFAPTLLGSATQSAHDHLYFELAGYSGQQAVMSGDFKAVRRNLARGRDELELYDLAQDPSESRNLAAELPDVAQRMRMLMETSRSESAEFPLFKR
jgi:arylsulfatase